MVFLKGTDIGDFGGGFSNNPKHRGSLLELFIHMPQRHQALIKLGLTQRDSVYKPNCFNNPFS